MASLSMVHVFQPHSHQNVVVMRHADRIDQVTEAWLSNAARPWDPPLVDAGRARAFRTGLELKTRLGCPIHRVCVSPFSRCVETAFEVVSALCAIGDTYHDAEFGAEVPIDPSKIKASIEYGLCEVLNDVATGTPPSDGDWGFDHSELALKLPAGTVDPKYKQVIRELPEWGESWLDGRARLSRVICALADKYSCENLLLITHGEGLRAAASTFLNGTRIHELEYCAYFNLRRHITRSNNGSSFPASKFSLAAHHGYVPRNKDS